MRVRRRNVGERRRGGQSFSGIKIVLDVGLVAGGALIRNDHGGVFVFFVAAR